MAKTVGEQKLCDGNARGTGTIYDDAAVLFFLACNTQTVDNAGKYHDGGAVLVVMEDRNVKHFFQAFLNLKAARCGNIFQIDAAVCGSNVLNRGNDLLRVLGVETDRHGIDIAEFLKQNAFSLHDRHGGICADIAETENCTSVGNDGDGVGFHGIFVSSLRGFGDYLAGLGNTWRVCDGEIFAGVYFGFCDGLKLSVPFFVHKKCLLGKCHCLILHNIISCI